MDAAATVTGGKGVVMTYQMALGMRMQNKHKALLVAGLVAVVKKARASGDWAAGWHTPTAALNSRYAQQQQKSSMAAMSFLFPQ